MILTRKIKKESRGSRNMQIKVVERKGEEKIKGECDMKNVTYVTRRSSAKGLGSVKY